jgi:hypothetical protein
MFGPESALWRSCRDAHVGAIPSGGVDGFSAQILCHASSESGDSRRRAVWICEDRITNRRGATDDRRTDQLEQWARQAGDRRFRRCGDQGDSLGRTAALCAQFALLVNHDDADREFAYTKAAEKSVASAASWLDGREHDERLDHGVRERRRAMTDPTAIDLRLNSTPHGPPYGQQCNG